MTKTIFQGTVKELSEKIRSLQRELFEEAFKHLKGIVETLRLHGNVFDGQKITIVEGFQNDVTWFDLYIDISSGGAPHSDVILGIIYKEMGTMPHIDVLLEDACHEGRSGVYIIAMLAYG